MCGGRKCYKIMLKNCFYQPSLDNSKEMNTFSLFSLFNKTLDGLLCLALAGPRSNQTFTVEKAEVGGPRYLPMAWGVERGRGRFGELTS
jgi:hypothetical protein